MTKKAPEWSTIEGASFVSEVGNLYTENVYNSSYQTMEGVMIRPSVKKITKAQKKLVENYLTTFRDITVPNNASFKLKADIIPFDTGVAMRVSFGPKEEIKFWPEKNDIAEASRKLGIDIDQYSSQAETNIPENKRTYVIVDDRKIIYLIKGFNASENWGSTGVNRDVAAILGGTM